MPWPRVMGDCFLSSWLIIDAPGVVFTIIASQQKVVGPTPSVELVAPQCLCEVQNDQAGAGTVKMIQAAAKMSEPEHLEQLRGETPGAAGT